MKTLAGNYAKYHKPYKSNKNT